MNLVLFRLLATFLGHTFDVKRRTRYANKPLLSLAQDFHQS